MMIEPVIFGALQKIARGYLRPIDLVLEILLGAFGVKVFGGSAGVDDRLKKIDTARDSLKDVLEALDDLHYQAEVNRREATNALANLEGLKQESEAEQKQLMAIKAIAENDTQVFRKLAGIKSAGFERLVGFIGGICASLIATAIWEFLKNVDWF